MTESAFSRALDALVRGEEITSNDDLTRFAGDLYEKEHTVMMPGTMKTDLAEKLGFQQSATEGLRVRPVSRRTARGEMELPWRKPVWIMASTIAVAMLLALTSVVQWGLPGGDDKQSGFIASAIPTVNATPEATPDPMSWVYPISSSECPQGELERTDQTENPAATFYTEEDYAKVNVSITYEPFGEAAPDDADAVVTRLRQHQACAITTATQTLPIWTARFEYENRTTAGQEAVAAEAEIRLIASQSLSAWYEDEVGLTPSDMFVVLNPVELGIDEWQADHIYYFYNPDYAVRLGDGRIGVIPSAVVFNEHGVTNYEMQPAFFVPWVAIFVERDGVWMLDETMPICIGLCDTFWQNVSATPLATPGEVNELEPVTAEDCPGDHLTETSMPELPDFDTGFYDSLPQRC